MTEFVNFNTKSQNAQYEGVFDIAPAELQQVLSKVKLIDVRQPEEYVGELGHIPGSELIVLDTLPDHLSSIPKDQTVVFICRSGNRSARATAFALMNGFTQVYNLHGGMILWNNLLLPIER
ncbi:MAG: rhodanese-like domain-containing protein [Bdellovibrio sp.]